jgi:hypothetical protein
MKLKDILLFEYIEMQQIEPNLKRLDALKSIAYLLDQVDHSSEVLPDDSDRILRLLTSLKGESLTDIEFKIVKECTDK